MDDSTLRQDIIDELEFEPSLDAASIGIAVEKGIVTLTGHVANYTEKVTARDVVQRVKGVRGIADRLEIRLMNQKKTADDEIAARAIAIIDWDTTIPESDVQVVVSKGWITLKGDVDWQYQRESAEHAVRKLSGVSGVSNLITVRKRPQPADVKSRIEAALRRNAEIEANAIRVSVHDSSIVLEGHVHSWSERRAAQNAAWSVPGIAFVDDRLSVD